MASTTIHTPPSVPSAAFTDPVGASAWIAGGACWLAAGLLHANEGWRFDAAALTWLTADALVAIALGRWLRHGPHGTSVVGRAALWAALVARVMFAIGEVVSIADGHDDNPWIPAAALLSAAALLAYGVVVARRLTVGGLGRWAPLAAGLYPFAVMFPVLAATGEPSSVLIGLWGIPMALLATTPISTRR